MALFVSVPVSVPEFTYSFLIIRYAFNWSSRVETHGVAFKSCLILLTGY